MQQIVNELGFESVEEYYRLISNVDLTSSEKLIAFYIWEKEDGTKSGLKKL